MQKRSFGQHEMVQLVQMHWERLTEADVQTAGNDRAALARTIAHRYGVPVSQAKREVRDFLRVVGPGKIPGGKRGRRAMERLDRNSAVWGSLGGEPGTDPDQVEQERVESAIPGDLAGGIGTDPDD